ncbi:MAG: MFS transporter [Bacteroidales bacterium]|nr:MFS transporter [Bacteroidales bacterium]
MSLYSYFRISKPSPEKVSQDAVPSVYKHLRNSTFWGVTAAYSIFYMCRLAMSVVKKPLIDEGIFSAGELGIIGSAFLLVYAAGKFINGIICDYCNIKRFMAAGLGISALINLIMGLLGLVQPMVSVASGIIMFILFSVCWGVNGWAQSMGAPPAVISLSRWFSLKQRGTYYSILSSTPYLGKTVSFILLGFIVSWLGWQFGFILSAIAGLAGFLIILCFVKDNPESQGLPSIQEITGDNVSKADKMPTRELQKYVFKNPGIWVIALSSAFVYITQYAISDWGILYLEEGKGFSEIQAPQIISFSEAFGIAGTLLAGWISDRVFKGSRIIPVILSGLVCLFALSMFLFTGGGYLINIVYVSLFSLAIGMVFCIVAGLMALDIVPRKATGTALGIVGIISYVAAGIQSVVSGFLIQHGSHDGGYDFTATAYFWMAACLLSFLLPVAAWHRLHKKVVE